MTIRLLLADDHAIMRDGLKALLGAQADFEVVADVGNGHEALHKTEALQPDVVVMDLSMPDLNGVEATRQLRSRRPKVQVIMLSMHSTPEHVFHALEAGAAGYVLKESAGTELVLAVRTVHAGRRYLSPQISESELAQMGSGSVSPIGKLSTREHQVLQLAVEGHSSAEIARRLHLSPKTVETYRARLRVKLGVSDMSELIKFAVVHGLTPSSPKQR